MLRTLWNDEAGVIISAELVLVLTIAVLAMIVGLSEVAVAVNEELNDISNAVGNFDQSYTYVGFVGANDPGFSLTKNDYHGASWADKRDNCDKNDSVISCSRMGGECDQN